MTHEEAKRIMKKLYSEITEDNDVLEDDEKEAFNMAMSALHDAKWQEYENGHWNYAQCSECKTIHDSRSNYCPFCGARMDGDYAGLTKIEA